MNKIYFLIGFMGSGKSFLGREAARQLGYHHIEMDDMIIRKAGMSINAIFEKHGEPYFRELESAVIDEIILSAQGLTRPTVVSTGGGAPCHFDNMDRMKETGTTIFIRPDEGVLAERLAAQKEDRPLVRNRSEAEIRQYVATVMEERLPYYRKAAIVWNPVYPHKYLNADLLKRLILT